MQKNEHEWQSNQDETQREDALEQSQVPSSLLSNVLHHLELSPEQAVSELSLEVLLLKLRSGEWQERAQALYALGKVEHAVSLDLLAPLLHDEDETVRATALSVLGTMSGRVQIPLHWLLIALQDKNWHVRENAVFVLAKQGSRVPIEVIMTALHDRDGSVREAASFVLQQRSNDEAMSALYGQLREETSMRLNDSTHSHSQRNGQPPAAAMNGEFGTFREYSSNAARGHTVNEHMQSYASGYHVLNDAMLQESVPEEHAEEVISPRKEKVTSYRRLSKSYKGWWIATVIITTLLFFGVGRFSTTIVPQANLSVRSNTTSVAVPERPFRFDDRYARDMYIYIASDLKLVSSPQSLHEHLQVLGSLQAVAKAQGVSASDLEKFEMDAFNQIFTQILSGGSIDIETVNVWMAQLKSDSGLRDKIVLRLLNYDDAPPIM